MSVILNFSIPYNVLTGTYDKTHFKTSIIGSSDCNNYIPFYSLFYHELIKFKDSDIQVAEYNLPIDASLLSYERRYQNFISQLKSSTSPRRFLFTIQSTGYYLNFHRGILYDTNGVVLMCLAINTEYIFKEGFKKISEKPDTSKFCLFIGKEFSNPIYKNIKKKIEAEYINVCIQEGIDVVNTELVNNRLFKNNYEQPKFKNVIEMNKFLKEEVPKYILID